jgi:hypothetical protein
MSDDLQLSTSTPARRGGVPGLILAFGGLIFAGVIGVFGMVGYTFFQARNVMNMPEERVQTLAPQIVDRNVTAQSLEKQGYYPVKFGGFYIDDCREKVLTDHFNDSLSVGAKADKINSCIYQNIVETSAAANSGVRYRHR